MATIVLQTAGAAIGGALGGPIGAAIGQAAGAIAGSYVDQQLFGPGDQSTFGPRLDNVQLLSSRSGAPVPRLYGSHRISGEIIWATRYEEVANASSRSQGGKGGGAKTTATTYSYLANFAIGLCEGEIGGIGRMWVDGHVLDRTKITHRIYKGSEDQLPDSLIEAKQGNGNAPAYRGLAYVVFENLPLEQYGNRIPQIAVEVIRPTGNLERHVRAVNMIPGASEFAYDTEPVVEQVKKTQSRQLNVNQINAETDFLASLDDLQAACPNLEQVALVVAWFGDDLRAGYCQIKPKVEVAARNQTTGGLWSSGGITRETADLVSTTNGTLSYGGTPSDVSILNAISELKSRGLRVCLNPFVMMDITPGNNLADPYGHAEQAAFPWRGRITGDLAFGQSGSSDKTILARQQVNNFLGSFSVDDVVISGSAVNHIGAVEWSYRRMILHYARIAELAGGVDMFLLGSELRGLTSLRDEQDAFPFVEGLINLADDVRPMVGAACQITYGADWSEYFGFQPNDGSGDVFFNLDSLWAAANIDCVGIDNYMPISDFRRSGEMEQEGRASTDPDMLYDQITSGEGFDWYYASDEDRQYQQRTPITDGLGKPWIYRFKDLHNWWSQPHYNRIAGIEQSNVTPWVPQSKPVVFTEFGCPAVHNGPAQPNVFVDRKSSESAVPHFSNGGRDDQAQASYLEAVQKMWDVSHPLHKLGTNPVSALYGLPMVDMASSQIWAWDARPYPAFPQRAEIWGDSDNWTTGHWLNGRLGKLRISDLIRDLCHDSGLENVDASQIYGVIDGFILASSGSVRASMEALLNLYQISVSEIDGVLVFRSPGHDESREISSGQIVEPLQQSKIVRARDQERDLPVSVTLSHTEPELDYLPSDTVVQRINGSTLRKTELAIPAAVSTSVALPVLEHWLQARWLARDSINFGLDKTHIDLTVGDEIILPEQNAEQRWRISRIEEGDHLHIAASACSVGEPRPVIGNKPVAAKLATVFQNAPHVRFLNLPYLNRSETGSSNLVAIAADPWPGNVILYSSSIGGAYEFRQSISSRATMGEVVNDFAPSDVHGRWDRATHLSLQLYDEALFSATSGPVLNGANVLAVFSNNMSWEVVQFQQAELLSSGLWRLSDLLRGQAGTEQEALSGSIAGASVVLLNSAVNPLANSAPDIGLEHVWTAGPVGSILGETGFSTQNYTPGQRGSVPYSPVHLRAEVSEVGDVELSWIRRDRLLADSWDLVKIPMSEEVESYLITLAHANGASLELMSAEPWIKIPAADISNTFGNSPTEITISVAQVSATVGAGPTAQLILQVPQNS